MKYSIATVLPFATTALVVQAEIVYKGCYSGTPDKGTSKTSPFNSHGECANFCVKAQKPIAYISMSSCFCVDEAPANSSLLRDDQCNSPCPGYSLDMCGSRNAFTVLETGYRADSVQGPAPVPSPVTSDPPRPISSSNPEVNVHLYGCYTSVDGPSSSYPVHFNSHRLCALICRTHDKTTALLRYNECICTNSKPVPENQLSADQCANPCSGLPNEMCGGEKGYTVLDNGYESAVQSSSAAAQLAAASTAAAAAAGGNGTASTSTTSAPTSSVQVAGAVSVRGFTGGVFAGVCGLVAYNLL